MEKFTLEELYNAYEDCVKNKKSSIDYLETLVKVKKIVNCWNIQKND